MQIKDETELKAVVIVNQRAYEVPREVAEEIQKLRAAFEKRVIDTCFDRLVSDKPDGTVRAILNKDQTELLIGAKGAPQVASIMKILGEAGSSIIGKRFV